MSAGEVAAPFVGPPSEGEGCAYAVDLDSPACNAQPSLHVQVRSEAWGATALATCNTHAAVARSSGTWITEHPYGPECPESAACWQTRGATTTLKDYQP
jgi:hypothetical protein